MPTRSIVLLLALLAVVAPAVAGAGETGPPTGGYLRALALAREGDVEGATSLLERLAVSAPASVPVHRDLARFVLASGRQEAVRELRQLMRRRLRRTSRDVGANVAMAILEEARGRRPAAHRHLLTALTAGCRDPLLVPLLLATSPSPDGLLAWLARRRAVIPGDSAFRALEARALLARNRVPAARRLLDEGLRRDPEHPDLLALRAELLRAEGREGRACELAEVALGFLAARQDVPETRVPLRLVLARTLAACGRPADAEAVLAGLGTLLVPPGAPPLEPVADVGRAEVALAAGDPLRALALLRFLPGDPRWEERYPERRDAAFGGLLHPRAWARSVAARALVALGLPGVARLLPAAVPVADAGTGLILADREECAAARLASGDGPVPPGRIVALADELSRAGFDRRELRLRLAAAARGLLPVPPAAPADDPDLCLAREIVALLPAPPRTDLDELLLAPAHGLLRAAFRTGRATALAAAGRWEDVPRTCRDGLLDLEEATRTTRPLRPELVPLLRAWGTPALVLPGLAARAALASGTPPRRVVAELFHDLGRAARQWSRIESPWPRDPRDPPVPAGCCLVLATPPGPGAVTVAIAPGGTAVVRPGNPDPRELGPCRAARAILWAGPASPESRGLSGLGAPGGPLLVRLPHPGDPALPPVRRPRPARPPRPLGADRRAPLRPLVEALAGFVPPPGEPPPLSGRSEWFAFGGPGLAPPGAPASAGWLVPASMCEGGWMTPEALRALPPGGPGLVALGLAIPGTETEPAAWLLAESALLSGRGWALLSRVPLGPGERRVVARRLASAGADAPVRALRALVLDHPELGARLELWTIASRVRAGGTGSGAVLPAVAGLAIVLGAAFLLVLRRRRRGRRVSP